MSTQENEQDLFQNSERYLIHPAVAPKESETTPDLPVSVRGYDLLPVVDVEQLKKAAWMGDTNESVVSPMGGYISIGWREEDGPGFIIQDIEAVQHSEDAVLYYGPAPMMVDDRPPETHDPEKEIDFGRIPNFHDLVKAAANPPKEHEYVLSMPAAPFLDVITDTNVRKNLQLEHLVYPNLAFTRRSWCEKDTRFVQFLPYIVFYKWVHDHIYVFVYQRGKGVGEERLAMKCSIGVGGHPNPHDFLTVQAAIAEAKIDWSKELNPDSNVEITFDMKQRLFVDGFWTGIAKNVLREVGEEVKITHEPRDVPRLNPDVINFGEYLDAKCREADERLEYYLFKRTAFFVDYTKSDVEKVHIGMFIGIELPADFEVATNEEELHDVGFIPLDALQKDLYEENPSFVPTALENWTNSILDSLSSTINAGWVPSKLGMGSKMSAESAKLNGEHSVSAEEVATIPLEDRWKMGTLSRIFGERLDWYAYNVFVHA